MMGSRDFYSSLNEVQLNVKEINSLQLELSKKINYLKNKNISIKANENEKYINPQYLESKRSDLIGDTDLSNVEMAKYNHDNNVENSTFRTNEDIQFNKKKNNHDSVQINKDSITSESNYKNNNSNNVDIDNYSKSKNKIGNKLSIIMFVLIWEALIFLCLYVFML